MTMIYLGLLKSSLLSRSGSLFINDMLLEEYINADLYATRVRLSYLILSDY